MTSLNMLKFVILSVMLSQNWCKIFAIPPENSMDTAPSDLLPSISGPKFNNTDNMTLFPGNYNFHASHQAFYFYPPYGWKSPEDVNSDSLGEEIRSDYTVTIGVGAHKLHRRKFSWNLARRTCVEEGGHLAIIRSEAEAKIISQMMHEASIETAWVGFHDKFEEGDWVTVLDEPLAGIPWAPWSKAYSPNPNNAGGDEHCADFLRDSPGLNDNLCSRQIPFVCKISIT